MATFYPFTLEVGSKNTNLLGALSSKLTNNNESFAFALAKSYIKSQQTYFMSKISLTPCQTKSPLAGSLRSCPLPNIPLCLSREEGIIFFLLALSALEKKKTQNQRAWSQATFSGHLLYDVISRFSLAFYRGRKFQIVFLRPSQVRLGHCCFEAESIFIYWAIMSFCSWNSEKYRDHFEAGKP